MNSIPNWQISIKFEIKNDEHNPGEDRYCVETADGQCMFLRISPKEAYESKKIEHEMMERVYNLGVPTAKPIDFGFCDDGKVYSLTSWIDGEDMQIELPLLPETAQYAIGVKAGKNLRLIHSVPAPADKTPEEWETGRNGEFDWKVGEYLKLNSQFIYEEYLLNYIEKSRYLLKNRLQGLLHYDYNLRNILLVNKSEPCVIDFGDYDFGDPWRDFNYTFASEFPHFLTGMVNGYFNNQVPEAFFPTLLLYSSIHQLQIFMFDGVNENTLEAVAGFVKYYDYMKNPVPAWYLNGR